MLTFPQMDIVRHVFRSVIMKIFAICLYKGHVGMFAFNSFANNTDISPQKYTTFEEGDKVFLCFLQYTWMKAGQVDQRTSR
jgi:hypothetical protein